MQEKEMKMSPSVRIDPYLIKKAQEWLKHKQLVAEVENLGEPAFKIPRASPYAWDLPSSLFMEMDHDTLKEIALNQIDYQINKVNRQIDKLGKIKEQFEKFRKEI